MGFNVNTFNQDYQGKPGIGTLGKRDRSEWLKRVDREAQSRRERARRMAEEGETDLNVKD